MISLVAVPPMRFRAGSPEGDTVKAVTNGNAITVPRRTSLVPLAGFRGIPCSLSGARGLGVPRSLAVVRARLGVCGWLGLFYVYGAAERVGLFYVYGAAERVGLFYVYGAAERVGLFYVYGAAERVGLFYVYGAAEIGLRGEREFGRLRGGVLGVAILLIRSSPSRLPC